MDLTLKRRITGEDVGDEENHLEEHSKQDEKKYEDEKKYAIACFDFMRQTRQDGHPRLN